MSTTTTVALAWAADPALAHPSLMAPAAAGGVLDGIQAFISKAGAVAKVAVSAIVVIFGLWRMAQSRFTIASIFAVIVITVLVAWWLKSGMSAGDKLNNDLALRPTVLVGTAAVTAPPLVL